ncbi:MAG: hypothetical protein ACTSXH_10015 [Promethearchaeota archaeon]
MIAHATIDPYRDKVKVKKGLSNTVGTVLNKTLNIFGLMSIQYNLSEHVNAFLRTSSCLTGPKSIESVERRIRAKLILRNETKILEKILLSRHLQADFIYKNLNVIERANLLERVILA